MGQIDISVIIPVYNVEKYLAECLESVISQDMGNIELVCVNDGSKDSSLDILKAYAEKDDRILIIEQENQGLSCARNAGIDRAGGEYILFLDSDDCLAEHALKGMYETAETKALEILAYDAECFYETEELKKKEYKDNYYQRKREYSRVRTGEELFCELMENDDFCDAACLLFIRNSWLKKTGIRFMPGMLHEDCPFTFQCYMKVKRIAHRKQEYLRYRIRNDSIMTSGPSFASLRGRLFCYREVLGFLLCGSFSERTEAAVSKFAEFIMYNIKYTDFALRDVQKEETEHLPATDKLLMKSLDVGRAGRYTMNADMYLLGFQTLIHSCERILLYGAGKIGRLVWNYLKRQGMSDKVIGFAVSEAAAGQEKIEEKGIRLICEYRADSRTLVLITARWDYQKTMIKKAEEAGFQKIDVIDFRLEQMLRRQQDEWE